MDYRPLGRTGVRVSPLCLGTFNFPDPTPEDESFRIIERALAAGINFVDTADSYNGGASERVVGRALAQSGRRDQVVLTTKVHFPTGPGPNDRGNSRRYLIKACEDSLRRL
jgi:1-deoxyxylulose-5-phosphate synthase